MALKLLTVGMIAATTITAGGGVSAVAETSVPGDALYVVKRSVNEPIKEHFALSTAAEANAEADLAVERLKEINGLAAANKLDEKTRAELSDEFALHARTAGRFAVQAAAEGEGPDAGKTMLTLRQRIDDQRKELAAEQGAYGGSSVNIGATVDLTDSIRAGLAGVSASINSEASANVQVEEESSTEDKTGQDSEDQSSSPQSSEKQGSADSSASDTTYFDFSF